MQWSILLLSLLITAAITIGTTLVHQLLTIPVGSPERPYMIHVQPVGVFLTVAAMVYGLRLWDHHHLLIIHMTALKRE